jgi:hypothetical protein
MTYIRDTLAANETDDDFEAWMEALVPLTDRLLLELTTEEHGIQYPRGRKPPRLWPNKHEMQYGLLPKDLA